MSDSDSGRESPVVNYRPRVAFRHPKLIDNDRNTKLHYAAANNDVSRVVKYLETDSSIVDPQNYLGWTPLMMACRKGHLETVKCLLTFRANATRMNSFGMNVFQIAIASGNLELVEYLLDHFLTGGISKRILEKSFSVTSLAVLFRHQSILEYLIGKHFSINEGTIETHITPFMFAHAMENDTAISTLLRHKVDTKLKNCLGHTAVDIATIRQQMKVVHTNDHRMLAQKLAASAANQQQESIQNEIQNQQLRNVLQLKPDNNPAPSPNVYSAPMCSPHPQLPYIIVSPFANSSQIKMVSFPSQILPPARKSSNVSPFPIPPPPNVTPISPAAYSHMGGQIFFPSDFSPNQSPLNVTSPLYNSMASQSYNVNDFLNARFNSSAGMFLSPPVMNFLSPCM